MERKKSKAEINRIEKLRAKIEFRTMEENLYRARSLTVGTAFNGMTEISMRGDGGSRLWSILRPVEVIELINQLAAGSGCHIHIQPRNDFASWRAWRPPEQEMLGMSSAPSNAFIGLEKDTKSNEQQNLSLTDDKKKTKKIPVSKRKEQIKE